VTADIRAVARNPSEALGSHVNEQRVENALFMLRNGEDITRVASRLDLTVGTLVRMFERAGHTVPGVSDAKPVHITDTGVHGER
jgi:hypothetical protein